LRLGELRILATVFLSGFAVMAIEFAGSRMLTPFFGSSVFVWGSIIGVVLTSLAAGYYLGGRLSDLRPEPKVLDVIVFTGGVLSFSIPLASPLSIEAVVSAGLEERWGALAAAASLLAPANVLLGMVSPFSVKLLTNRLGELGSRAGHLYALSTLGSILGTFGTVFILIPALDIRTIFIGVGVGLMAISSLSLGLSSKATLLLLLLILLTPLGVAENQVVSAFGELVEARETQYNSLAVVRAGDLQILYLNGLPHSGMSLSDPYRLVFTYTKMFEAAVALNEGAEVVLFIGGGGFSGPKYFLRTFPQLRVEVVEIDPAVIDVAMRLFAVPVDERLVIHNDDGRVFLQKAERRYDAIILDAYAKTYIPPHLLTLEFFELLRSRLSERGVVVSNIIASLSGDTSEILWSSYKTMSIVFPKIYVVKASEYDSSLVQNIVLVACVDAGCNLEERVMGWRNPELRRLVTRGIWRTIPDLTEYPIMTDDRSPLERLINPVTGKPYSPELEMGGKGIPPLLMAGSNSIALAAALVFTAYWLLVLVTSILHQRTRGGVA